ncbi:bile acid:sodium symporter family protein [Corynebacterium sp. ES2794-CONJ1]|uniref:bile acid:sodium symporter family protein n=1 Tax=Corynebacterium sp. ES2794-CONJ1 TaxID=2980553 RepID=UPI0021D9D7E9|nr:bile acid:sodium symporter family protein [Corynebacterium sp. ES2794-CONJ1]MCU9519873.1 bile acid:sodium symporter family protein [Corynebacterium sp. ES2794-CONJ1]
MAAPEARRAQAIVLIFPAFIVLGSIVALIFPAPFVPITGYINYFLMVIMFAMGLTLSIPDFKQVMLRPLPIIIGVIAQFVIMPLLALAVGRALNLDPALAVGLLMLGSVPGGTSSNVIAFLARGDVALSVAMTSVSTLISPIMTPLIMLLLANAHTGVNATGMAWALVQTVLIPVVLGLVINRIAPHLVARIVGFLPWISIFLIGTVVFGVVGKNADNLATVGLIVFLSVLIHNALGYLLGYLTGRITGLSRAQRRTVATEVATQSAGLSSGMSAQFFSPEAALPGAVAAVWHNISGAFFVALCRRRDITHP